MIKAETILPSVALRPFVHHYWVFKTTDACISNIIILPEGGLHWMFQRKNCFEVNNISQNSIKASVTGLYDRAIHISSAHDVELIKVFFQPYAASTIMGMPCRLLMYDNIDFESLESIEFKELKRCVLDADNTEDCIGLIEDFILRRLVMTQGTPYIKQLQAVFRLMKENPEVRTSELASAACLSERQFRRVFTDNIGMTPKQIQRIMRFRHATNEIIHASPKNIDEILYINGYTDHSHFNHEFHDIAGLSPTEYITSLNEMRKRGIMPSYRSYHTKQ